MIGRNPNPFEWLALLVFICVCFLGAARTFEAVDNSPKSPAMRCDAREFAQRERILAATVDPATKIILGRELETLKRLCGGKR